MCAGPSTLPQRRSEEDVELIVREAKGEVVVGGMRSRTQDVRRDRLQGVDGWREEAGRMMWDDV